MRTTVYDQLIVNMPPGLEQGIITVLKYHIGKDNAIKKDAILAALKRIGYTPHERQFRDGVRNLRRDGWLIGSFSTDGYFLIENKFEFDQFANTEIRPRIADLSETLSAMEKEARQRFGEAVQVGLL